MKASRTRAGGRWLNRGETQHIEALERYKPEPVEITAAPLSESVRFRDADTIASLAGICGVSVDEFAGRYV